MIEHFAQPPDATEVESSLGSAVGHERALYHYRAYIGGALAVLILALGYMAFRSTQAMSGAAHPVSSTPPAAETEPATRPQAPAHPEVDVVVTRPKERAQPAVAVDDSALDKNPPPPASGSEEFAMAQSYLNGTEGKERNSAEAVKWLWKSVGKQNAAATLLLSDLYVKGEEVPKNCEQAHLLLDAAARKRIAGADARLRNLQTMGCE